MKLNLILTGVLFLILLTSSTSARTLVMPHQINMSWEGYNLTLNTLLAEGDIILEGDYIEVRGGYVNGSQIPYKDNVFGLGNLTNMWKDVYVGNNLNVYGNALLNGKITLIDNKLLEIGNLPDVTLGWVTSQTVENTLVWGLGADANSILFVPNAYKSLDYGHAGQSDPTIFIHSSTSATDSNDTWLGLSFAGNETGNITTGTAGNLTLNPGAGGITIIGDAGTASRITPANDDLFVSGELEVDGIFYLDSTTTSSVILADNTTAIACSASEEGGIIYSDTKHYGCDGTNWNALY